MFKILSDEMNIKQHLIFFIMFVPNGCVVKLFLIYVLLLEFKTVNFMLNVSFLIPEDWIF